MAQYGDQQYRREATQTDEYGNPVRKEYENLVQSDTGVRYEHEVRQTGGIMSDYDSTGHHKGLGTQGTRTGTYGTGTTGQLGTNIGQVTGVTDYDSSGLGTKLGSTTAQDQGLGLANHRTGTRTHAHGTGSHQGLGIGQATGGIGADDTTGRSTGQTGYQGLGTGVTSGTHGTAGHQGLGTNIGHATGGRSTGQTGYQGLGTEHVASGIADLQTPLTAIPMGGAGIGTGTRDVYGGRDTGASEEKVHGGHRTGGQQQTTTHEKKGVMEKIKEKLPGHH